MLILTRRPGEEIIIGGETIVTVLGISGNQVNLGIVAPKNISVHRKEIQERIENEEKYLNGGNYEKPNLRNKDYAKNYVDKVLERVNLRG